jgi:nicotinamide mononucleotide transporter
MQQSLKFDEKVNKLYRWIVESFGAKELWKRVFQPMTKFEKVWLTIFSAIILAATFYFSYSGTNWSDWKSIGLNWFISPVSALTGVICVLLVARASIYNYSFGLVQSLLYGYLCWFSGYYGDWLLNWFFFVPTQLLIFIFWKRHLRPASLDIVRIAPLKKWQILLIILLSLVALVGFGLALSSLDSWFINVMKRNVSIYSNITAVFGIALLGPMMDSSTEVLQIAAQFLCIARSSLQWPMWIATNVITIIMWGAVAITDRNQLPIAMPTLIMWVAFLFNSIYGEINWYRKG